MREILRHMGPKEVGRSAWRWPAWSNVTNSQMELVMQKFVDAIGESRPRSGMGSDEYIRNMLTSALGADKASESSIASCRPQQQGPRTTRMDPRAIAS